VKTSCVIRKTLAISCAAIALVSPGSGFGQEASFEIRPDVIYGRKDGMALTYDVFTPAENAKGVGLLFMVSGGWVSTWIQPEQLAGSLIGPFLKEGYTVIAVRHGSSPRYVIPEIVADIKLALKHVHDHAEQYAVDPARLGVFGFSAGGHLSLILGTQINHLGNPESNPRIRAVAAVFPPTDLEPYVDPENPLREQFPALKFDPTKAVEYSPLRHVTDDDAPTLLVHGDKDELVPLWHSEKIIDEFAKAEVPRSLIVMHGFAHGFDEAGNQKMFASMVDWFNEHLK
jgi:acetyl esterase/lipase